MRTPVLHPGQLSAPVPLFATPLVGHGSGDRHTDRNSGSDRVCSGHRGQHGDADHDVQGQADQQHAGDLADHGATNTSPKSDVLHSLCLPSGQKPIQNLFKHDRHELNKQRFHRGSFTASPQAGAGWGGRAPILATTCAGSPPPNCGRPAHFDDAAWADRQAFLGRRPRTLLADRLTRLLVQVLSIAVVLLLAALFADGLTGEHYLGEMVRQARVTT